MNFSLNVGSAIQYFSNMNILLNRLELERVKDQMSLIPEPKDQPLLFQMPIGLSKDRPAVSHST